MNYDVQYSQTLLIFKAQLLQTNIFVHAMIITTSKTS